MRRMAIWIMLPVFWVSAAFTATPAVEIQSETVAIRVKTDGCVERTVSVTMKVNTFQAIRTVGEWFYSYNPKLERVDILKSVTIHKDGKRFPAPKNAILDQTPASVENAPDFSFIREKMVSHTGLEPGCTIEFQYKVTDIAPHRSGIMELMGGKWPILQKTVTVQLDRKCGVYLNGHAIRETASGVYTVKHLSAIRPAAGFSTLNDQPFLYIRVNDPIKQVKTVMTNGQKITPDLLEMLGLDKNSMPMEVETELNHLLNNRLATVSLEPVFTAWTIRGLSRIIRSGYATPLEKLVLAHRVLNRYGIAHTAVLTADSVDNIPIAIHPGFQLKSELCNLTVPAGGVTRFPLWGKPESNVAGHAIFISAELKEGKDGTFAGPLTVEKKGFGDSLRLSVVNPLKSATISGEKVLLKTGNRLAKSGELKWKPEDRQIRISPILAHRFRLARLETALLSATSVRIPVSWDGVIHLRIVFRKQPSLVLPGEIKAANRFGSSSTSWSLRGKTLVIRQYFHLSRAKSAPKSFDELNALLIPILNPTVFVGFIR